MEAIEKSSLPHLQDVVPHHEDPTKERPAVFNFLATSGRNENAKQCLNGLPICAALNLKNDNNVPFAPCTVSSNLRTLFAELKRQGINWNLTDFQKWPGSVIDVIDQSWKQHLQEDETLGKAKKEPFAVDDCKKIVSFCHVTG